MKSETGRNADSGPLRPQDSLSKFPKPSPTNWPTYAAEM